MNIRNLSLILMMSASLASMADAPDGYYDSLEGKKRTDLRNEAKAIVGSHKRIPYGSSTWDAFKKTDIHFVDGRQAWWDMYSDNVVYTTGHAGMNIEHSMPNSWWGKDQDGDAYCDIINLNPSDETANSKKSNYPLGEVRDAIWTNGVSTVGRPVSGQGGGSSFVFEPADEYKGDFARQYLYMVTVYDDINWQAKYNWMYDTSTILFLKPWASELLLKWNEQDPVDNKERKRNDAVYKVQGNRNPFVDLPQLAEYIWGSKNTIPFTFEQSSGVTALDEQHDDITAVYDMQGQRLYNYDNLPQGIYIIRYNSGKTSKVIK
ncbi:MAG: endonuclease [Muribaculaceae bacterium]|nr:endonuclease [Muribaculaceae bacterium]